MSPLIRLWLRLRLSPYDWAIVADKIIVAGAVVLLVLIVTGVLS